MTTIYATPPETYEGKIAFRIGDDESACPYPVRRYMSKDGRRKNWLDGYYHEQIGHRLKEVFERHGVTW